MAVSGLSAQSDLALTFVKQSAQSAQALVNLIETSAEYSKALLSAGSGTQLDVSV